MNANKNLLEEENEIISLDDIELILSDDIKNYNNELVELKNSFEDIGNTEKIVDSVGNVIVEQFKAQISVVAGEDFFKDNSGLNLDLRNEAHIQTAENFEQGIIATHNKDINFKKRYEDWQEGFAKDANGNIIKSQLTGKEKISESYRDYIDQGRDKGSKVLNKDHVISVAENQRDPEFNAFLDKSERKEFINSNDNIQDLDSAANQSKGDMSAEEWLDKSRNGVKNGDRFNVDQKKMRENDKVARKKKAEVVDEGKRKAIETGKQSQRKEVFNISGKALRSALMILLLDFIKEIMQKVFKWLIGTKKSIEKLLDCIKEGVSSFVKNLKRYLVDAGTAVVTTIGVSIFNKVAEIIRKVWMMLIHGWKSLAEAFKYIKDPQNQGKSTEIVIIEVGKIVVSGLSIAGAIGLSSFFEVALSTNPILNFQIPILGSLASILSILLASIVSGIVGAIVINLLDKLSAKVRKDHIAEAITKTKKDALEKQGMLISVLDKNINNKKLEAIKEIDKNHRCAEKNIRKNAKKVILNDNIIKDNHSNINSKLKRIREEWRLDEK